MKTYGKPYRSQAGFTIPELLVAVTIVGILAAYAAPSFNNMMVNERIKSASFDISASLIQARSEAIKQNGSVTIAPTSGTTAWAGGWTVTGPDAAVITTQAAYPSSITITGSGTSIVYNRSGRATATGTLAIASPSLTTESKRCITIGLTGMPKSTVGAC